ncbi:hypothetical protein THASP1DRAFT_31798 [Thamnocephalis sphaerospora]|uniref:F-box domain-containing protein n=1 Tax=Thamnocephalis sphaerospora TaxID=78915 RepID=A0A4P9XKV7_9FUNG|nr:hypothetical protein THASP1DRAFT_31798 [Thamnocephalis sphaerospora]|eukprot:RKP06386.1 hypothetical protein THASP1DRAFT_31798 [Thamnocephalis sphaerospora]
MVSFDHLPAEVLVRVATCLSDAEALFRLNGTCRRLWLLLAGSNALWRTAYHQTFTPLDDPDGELELLRWMANADSACRLRNASDWRELLLRRLRLRRNWRRGPSAQYTVPFPLQLADAHVQSFVDLEPLASGPAGTVLYHRRPCRYFFLALPKVNAGDGSIHGHRAMPQLQVLPVNVSEIAALTSASVPREPMFVTARVTSTHLVLSMTLTNVPVHRGTSGAPPTPFQAWLSPRYEMVLLAWRHTSGLQATTSLTFKASLSSLEARGSWVMARRRDAPLGAGLEMVQRTFVAVHADTGCYFTGAHETTAIRQIWQEDPERLDMLVLRIDNGASTLVAIANNAEEGHHRSTVLKLAWRIERVMRDDCLRASACLVKQPRIVRHGQINITLPAISDGSAGFRVCTQQLGPDRVLALFRLDSIADGIGHVAILCLRTNTVTFNCAISAMYDPVLLPTHNTIGFVSVSDGTNYVSTYVDVEFVSLLDGSRRQSATRRGSLSVKTVLGDLQLLDHWSEPVPGNENEPSMDVPLAKQSPKYPCVSEESSEGDPSAWAMRYNSGSSSGSSDSSEDHDAASRRRYLSVVDFVSGKRLWTLFSRTSWSQLEYRTSPTHCIIVDSGMKGSCTYLNFDV